MCSWSHSTSGYSSATSRTTSSQNGIVCTIPFDFVADVSRPLRCCASSKAWRTIRVTPTRVNTDSWTAISSGKPRLSRPPISLYSPSTFSRTTTRSSRSAPAHRTVDAGERPGRPHVGELAEGPPDRDQQPPQGHVVGHARPADRAEQDRVEAAERCRSRRRASSRPVSTYRWHDQSKSSYSSDEVVRRRDGVEHRPRDRDHVGADPVARDDRDPVLIIRWRAPGLAEAEDRDQQRQEDQDQDRPDDVEADPRPDHLGDRDGAGAVDDRRSAASTPAA